MYKKLDAVLSNILDVLDETNTKATFFCLGELANSFPHVVKAIDERSHEIACHSNKHLWLNKLTKDQVALDTRKAIDSLEHCTGKKVLSYRAPAFSIGESNKWAFEVLKECGIERDASVFPAIRDFGGFSTFNQKRPSIIQINDIQLKEYPISPISILGAEIVYSGGGYFRFFPYLYISHLIDSQSYTMTYFHLWDLIPESQGVMSRSEYEEYFKESGSVIKRYKRYLKSNLGTKGAFEKLVKLIKNKEFISLEEAERRTDWDNVPIVEM
jgi:polysaccharide deacetylase family protein (PEP-CTERM system associated)